MTATDKTIETCNALLRGETSAVETYTQAIDKFAAATVDASLERIRADHSGNAGELRTFIIEAGGEPAIGSGLWGGFVQALEGAATLFGESPALRVLQQGEALGIAEYKQALEDPKVSEKAKDLIVRRLLPPLSDHLIDLQNRRERAS